jgi:hypothetical protein
LTTGATFDITDLIKKDVAPYEITDGDIPCTLNQEQNFSYLFNFCNNVDLTFAPPECRANQKKNNWKAWTAIQFDTIGKADDVSHIVLFN